MNGKKWYSPNGNKCAIRKARVFHECSECGNSINPKEEYLEIVFLGDDDEFHTWKICALCRKE